MAEITKAIRSAHGLTADLIPDTVLKSIPQAELIDRLVHVADLTKRARQASDPVIARGYRSVAKAVLTAKPRRATEQQFAAMIAKAAGIPSTRQADAIRREAQELMAANPIAPRRGEQAKAIAKAKGADEDLVVVYDSAGNAIGVVDRSEITPVTNPTEQAAIEKAQADGVRTILLHNPSPGKGRPEPAARRRAPGRR